MPFETFRWEAAHALRRLVRSPGFTVAVLLSLMLGIGADITMLGIVDSLLFRSPAGVRDVDRLVDIRLRTYPDYADVRDQVRSFSGVAGWFAPPRPYALTAGNRIVPVQQMLASASLFPVLGARPLLGRFYGPEEDQPGGPHVAVLGYAFWVRQFGATRDILGKTLHVAGDNYTIVGVAPEGFTGVALTPVDLFMPITTTKFDAGPAALSSRDYSWLHVVARLAPGATIARAQAETQLVYLRGNPTDTARSPQMDYLGGRPADVHPVMEFRRELALSNTPITLWLSAVATVVLLIACANVAGLFLARGVRGRHEMAVRAALGASRGRLAGVLLLETGFLAIGGGGVALIVARWADALIRDFVITDLARVSSFLDVRFIILAVVVTTGTAVLCGAAPALVAWRGSLAGGVVGSVRTVSGSYGRARRALAAVQIALALVLVVGASLFTTSFRNARAMDVGMSLDAVLISDLNLAGAGYSSQRAHALIGPLIQRLSAIPGVRSVALSDTDMKPGWITYGFSIPGTDSPTHDGTSVVNHSFSAVTPEFFATLGTPIIRGRGFASADREARVIIVSDGFARLHWPGENPIGHCLRVGSATAPCNEVIGVAHDRRGAPGDISKVIEAYVPLGSPAEPAKLAELFPLSSVALRVDGDPAKIAPSAQRVLQDLLPDAPSIRVRPALSMFDRAMRVWRLGASVFVVLGGIAITLAIFGVYAAIAYLVGQRRREIAIRVAVGATPNDVLRLVLGETLRMAAVGVAFGLVAAALLAHGVRALLFGVSPLEPAAYEIASIALLLTALAASVIPLHSAIAIDPSVALRNE
jgi:putative ABC transport system permease protein